MRLVIRNISVSLVDAMRRCGYGFERRHDTGELSASRKVGGGEFPRYHMYAKFLEESPSTIGAGKAYPQDGGAGRTLQVTIHIDQKAPSYGGSRAHSGEYEGPLLDKEAKRIQDSLMRE